MVDNSLIFVIARSIERLLIDTIFGASLVMGWNLFRTGVLEAQSAVLSGKGLTLQLQRVGPGVFFALFGAIGLAIAIHNPLDLKQNVVTPAGESAFSESSYASSSTQTRDLITAITTLQMFGLPNTKPNNSVEKAATDRALSVLDAERVLLLKATFPTSYDRFSQLSKTPRSPVHLSPEDEARFSDFQALSNRTFITDPKE